MYVYTYSVTLIMTGVLSVEWYVRKKALKTNFCAFIALVYCLVFRRKELIMSILDLPLADILLSNRIFV